MREASTTTRGYYSFRIKPSMAWLIIFLPALAYYMVTRLYAAGLFRGSTIGQIVETTIVVYSSSSSLSNNKNTNASRMVNACKIVESTFYTTTTSTTTTPCESATTTTTLPLKYPLYLVQEDLDHVMATCWRHDSELGRGFLLLSTAGGQGRIWRWETGGGPIAIGRTLSVERSGCRSNLYQSCLPSPSSPVGSNDDDHDDKQLMMKQQRLLLVGSGGIAIDSLSSNVNGETNEQKEHFSEGKLVVAEWGEGRIARMEENGARTPLVIQVPDIPASCSSSSSSSSVSSSSSSSSSSFSRVHQPRALLFSPFGDLFFFNQHHDDNNNNQCGGDTLLQLRQSVWIEPLESLHVSRQAHAWTSLTNNNNNNNATTMYSSEGTAKHPKQEQQQEEDDLRMLPEIRFHATQLGGMTLDTSWLSLYITAKQSDGSVVLLSMPLGEEEDDDDGDDGECDAMETKDDDEANKACMNNKSTSSTKPPPSTNAPPTIVLNYSDHASDAGPVAIDKLGRIFLATKEGVLLVVADPEDKDRSTSSSSSSSSSHNLNQGQHQIVGSIATPQTPTALTVGEDGFLYIATDSSLLRIRVQQGPVQIPTNLVFQKKTKKKKS